MIAVIESNLTGAEAAQIERRELAIGSWKQGEVENAEILLDGVLSEPMTSRVAVQCWVSKAAFRAEAGDYPGSLRAVESAGEFLDLADLRVRGSFFNQRARIHNRFGNTESALVDYAGASACFEEAGDKSYQGAALLNVAELYLQQLDLRQARLHIDLALVLLTESSSEYLCQGYDTLAQVELAEGRTESALLSMRRAFDLVGDNEIYRQDLLKTRDKIGKKIEELSGALHSVNVDMVRRALIQTGGNLTQTGKLTGLTHKGVSYIVDRHPDLEEFRVKRRMRTKYKSIMKS